MDKEMFEKLTRQAFIDSLSTARNIYKGLEDKASKDIIAASGLNILVPIRLKQLIREQERLVEAKRLYAKLIELQDANEIYAEKVERPAYKDFYYHTSKTRVIIIALCDKLGIDIGQMKQFCKDSSTIEGMNKLKEIVEFMLE